MIISSLSEEEIIRLVSGREFAVIKINADFLKKPRYKQKFRPLNHLGVHFDTYILQVDGKDNSGGRTYLFIKDKLPKFKQVDGIEISYPSIVELISMLSGKRLIYYNKFAEDHCNVEDTVNRHMQDDVFNLINEDEYFLYREFFCVQVFLQRISETDTAGHTVMTPSDVRNYDITSKLLAMLTEGCNSFYNDAIIIRYEMGNPSGCKRSISFQSSTATVSGIWILFAF